MKFTLGTAAKTAGVGKATISRAIARGRLSAERQPDGSYAIDASELFRAFPPERAETGAEERLSERSATRLNGHAAPLERDAVHQQQIADRERERAQLLDQIADLRRRLDAADEERRAAQRTIAALIDSRTAVPTGPPGGGDSPPASSAPARRRWWRFRSR